MKKMRELQDGRLANQSVACVLEADVASFVLEVMEGLGLDRSRGWKWNEGGARPETPAV